MTTPYPLPPAAHADQENDVLTIPATLSSAGRARVWVRERALAAGLGPDAAGDVELAVGEAATNAIVHGCRAMRTAGNNDNGEQHTTPPPEPVVTIVAGVGETWIYVEIWDPGQGFDPAMVRSTDPSDGNALGGRGLLLMQALMDDVTTCYHPGRGMCVRLRRRLE